MSYLTSLLTLSPDHLWDFDGDFVDSVSGANGTNSGFTIVGNICEGVSNSVRCNTVNDRVTVANTATITGAFDRKAIGGWVRLDSLQLPPKSIYREGTTGTQLNFVLWAGNNLMLDVVSDTDVFQAYSNNVLVPNRTYHIFAKIEGTSYDNSFSLYIDGVKQGLTEPASGALGLATIAGRGDPTWGDPSGGTEVGNATVLLNGPETCRYQYWAGFIAAAAQLTDTEIREVLFEEGAFPSVIITQGNPVIMQNQLTALSGTVRENQPLNIRVEPVNGDIDLTLTADNITHDPLASIHVQYTGTATLTYINSNGSNASIGSTPNGGTINFVTPRTLTVAPLIAGTEVRVYQSGTSTELGGVENSTTNFSLLVQAPTVDVVIHNEEYVYIRVDNLDMSSGDVALPVSQQFDRGYSNP